MIQLNLTNRIGIDNIERSWFAIERLYQSLIYNWVDDRLNNCINKKTLSGDFMSIVRWSKQNLKRILLAKPEELQIIVNEVDKNFGSILHKDTSQLSDTQKKRYTKKKDRLLNVFGYKLARKNKLVQLAGWLNVKTCPYCNMQYTLNVQNCSQSVNQEEVALFQFDHFFDKSDYPMLSLSLYNLIPSCPTCNHGKSKGRLSLKFHPYCNSIADNYTFRIKNPFFLIWGDTNQSIEVELVPNVDVDIKAYDDMFHISKQYAWHKDVVQEIFAKEYAFVYYGDTSYFNFLQDEELKNRLIRGYYTAKSDIILRPLTKFQQDIQKQAHDLLIDR